MTEPKSDLETFLARGYTWSWTPQGVVFWVDRTMKRGQFEFIATQVRLELEPDEVLPCPTCGFDADYKKVFDRSLADDRAELQRRTDLLKGGDAE